jgi:serine/threonine protein kinase
MARVAGFELRERLGGGMAGEVYRAVNLLADEEVALKFIKHQFLADHPTAFEALKREIFAMQVTADHPHTSGVKQVRIE